MVKFQSDRILGKSKYLEHRNATDSPVILILNAVVVAVMNYFSQIFASMESLGLEIQAIQSAMAGIHRWMKSRPILMQALKRASERRTVVAISHRVSGEMVENESRTWMEIRRFKP